MTILPETNRKRAGVNSLPFFLFRSNTTIRLKLCFYICTSLLFLTACGNSGDSNARWTFMVYMDADNNLSSTAPNDLNEMKAVGSSGDVNIIVQCDTPGGTTKRYKVEKGGLTLLSELGEQDMAKADTLRKFVTYGAQNFPADHYALILWDHGNGWKSPRLPSQKRAIFIDQDNRTNTFLSNFYVAQAIKDGAQAAGIKIDILGIDACIMATIEAAYEFRNAAGILVASQELEQSAGWDYNDLLGRLSANPGMTPSELAINMVNSYKQYVESPAYGFGDQTISAISLGSGMETLAKEIDALAISLKGEMDNPSTRDSTLTLITNSLKTVQEFDLVTSPGTYVDLYDFSRLLEGQNNPVQAALGSVVIAEYHGNNRPNANGLSIVFYDLPVAQQYSVYDPDYKNFDQTTGQGSRIGFINDYSWDEMMHSYFSYQYPQMQN